MSEDTAGLLHGLDALDVDCAAFKIEYGHGAEGARFLASVVWTVVSGRETRNGFRLEINCCQPSSLNILRAAK
jgi:hypothetical protein